MIFHSLPGARMISKYSAIICACTKWIRVGSQLHMISRSFSMSRFQRNAGSSPFLPPCKSLEKRSCRHTMLCTMRKTPSAFVCTWTWSRGLLTTPRFRTRQSTVNEPGKKPESESYMWLYRTSVDTDKPIVLYEYQPGRGAKHPKEFLAG